MSKPLLKPADQRRLNDAYFTPPLLALGCCRTLREMWRLPGLAVLGAPRRILEPSAGGGSFVAAARAVWPAAHIGAEDVAYSDLGKAALAADEASGGKPPAPELFPADPRSGVQVAGAGAIGMPGDLGEGFDLILGNPPYKTAEEQVLRQLARLRPGGVLAFLLRLSFLAGAERAKSIYRKHPLAGLIPIAGRPSFTGNGQTDASEYGFFVFGGAAGDGLAGFLMSPLEWKP